MTSSNPVTNSFSLEREWLELRFRAARLTDRYFATESYVRIRVEGDDLAGFGEIAGSDDHIRIFLPPYDAAESPTAALPSVDELRACPSREFTPVEWGTPSSVVPHYTVKECA